MFNRVYHNTNKLMLHPNFVGSEYQTSPAIELCAI